MLATLNPLPINHTDGPLTQGSKKRKKRECEKGQGGNYNKWKEQMRRWGVTNSIAGTRGLGKSSVSNCGRHHVMWPQHLGCGGHRNRIGRGNTRNATVTAN